MKKLILFLMLMAMPFAAGAQTLKFGYLSYQEAITTMTDYAVARQNLKDLRGKYEAEMKRVEDEFNKKYEQFLDGQKDFAPSIRQKRQAELQEMMEKNVAFKQEARRLLEQAEHDAYAPLNAKLNGILQHIGKEKGYAFILNTDNNALPYVDPAMGENIIAIVKDALK